MATHLTKLSKDDLFLVNSQSQTYKIAFDALASDLAAEINYEGQISVDSLRGVNTDVYINTRDGDQTPLSSNFVDLNPTDPNYAGPGKDSANWLLQYLPTNFSGGPGSGEFVLADARNVFSTLGSEITATIELNTLNDVETQDGSDNYVPTVKGDTILICGTDTPGNQDTIRPEYKPGLLSVAVENLLNDGSIDISIEHLTEIHPNINIDPNDNENGPGGKLIGRLEIRDEYKNDGSDPKVEKKYFFKKEAVGADDVLVYIKSPEAQIENYIYPDVVGGELSAGWYPAENSGGGVNNFFDSSQIAGTNDQQTQGPGIASNLGVVRVCDGIDTVFVASPGGGEQIGPNGVEGAPTNIKITSNGILYSEIPDTLAFRGVVDVAGTQASPVTTIGGVNLIAGGPGNHLSPTDNNTNPTTGDFYVIVFDSQYTDQTVPLRWNQFNPMPDGVAPDSNAPDLNAKNGDIVALGFNEWSIIGNANTDSIKQDLDDVLTEGHTSDKGIELTSTSGTGLGITVGSPKDAGTTLVTAGGGDVACQSVKAMNIDFGMFETLPDN